MQRRTFLTGLAASAVVPALPIVPARAVTASEIATLQAAAFARMNAVLLPLHEEIMRQMVLYGRVFVDYSIWPPKVVDLATIFKEPNSMQLYITLAGANFRPKEAKEYIRANLHPGSVCELEREPDNPYDSNAVKIICDGVFIGYVPRTDNAVLAMALDAGAEAKVKNNGFVGTIQPTFTIDFEPPSIEERNAALDDTEDTDSFMNGGGPAIDDEIPF